MEKKQSILVVGSMNMDVVLKSERVPSGGETIFGESYSYIPGGKGANQGVAAARLGAAVTFVGRVGKDSHGSELKSNLSREGISTEYVGEDEETGTGLAAIMLEKTGQNRIIVFSGANMKIDKKDLRQAFENMYDAVILQFEVSQEILEETCSLARKKGIPVILDAGPAKEFPLEKLQGLEIISPNETEAHALTGIEICTVDDARKASEILKERSNAKTVVIKLGDKGSYIYSGNEGELIPSYKVKAVDTTAAGDAFTAALAIKYIEHNNIKEAVKYANAVGALTVTKLGAQPSIPTKDEVEGFIKKNQQQRISVQNIS